MLEIIALVLLGLQISKLAKRKGLKPGTWVLYTVLLWIAGEFIGILTGMLIFGKNLFPVFVMGIGGAIGGYFIIKTTLDKKPDNINDDIDKIGVDDLRP